MNIVNPAYGQAAIRVAAEEATAPDSCALMEELSAVLASITGSSGKASFDPQDVSGPMARFVVARGTQLHTELAGPALGCGAFRPLHEGVAEIKRMYARPDIGVRGVGAAILRHLEAEALALEYRALWLETRLVNQRAVDFYVAHGYLRIANYGKYAGNPLAACFEKRLPVL
jgi:ribosomal protein S18 acetylase RimI-like enzyme